MEDNIKWRISKNGGGQSGINKASSDLQNQINDIKRSYLPLTGGTITGDLIVNNEILNQSGKVVATQDFSSASVTDLINKVRFTNGVMGSVCFSKSEYGAKATWYNFIWIPHRFGGVNMKPSGDNCNYGTLLLFPMTFDGNALYIRYCSNTIYNGKVLA